MQRRPLQIAGYVAGGIGLLLLLALALVHTPPVRRYVLSRAASIMAGQGITFDAAGFDYNLLSLTVTLRDVVIRSKATADLPPIAKIASARVNLGLLDIINGKLRVQQADITDGDIYLVIDEKGRDNVPRPPQSEKKSESTWLIEQMRVSRGSLRVDDRRQKINLLLPSWRIEIAGEPNRDHHIRFATDTRGEILFQQRRLPVEAVNAAVLLRPNSAEVRSFELRLRDSRLTFAGNLDNFDDPRFDVKVATDLQLASAVEFAGLPQQIRGSLHAEIAAKGPLGALNVIADLASDDLSFEEIDNIRLRSRAIYDRPTQRVRIESLDVDAPEGKAKATGNIAMTDQAGASEVQASIQGLALEPLLRAIKSSVVIASRASGSLKATWPGLLYEKASGSGALQLQATRSAPARDVLPVTGRITFRGTAGNVAARLHDIRTMGTVANGEVRLAGRGISGTVTANTQDLGSTVQAAGRFAGKALLEQPLTGTAQVTARLSGTLAAPRIAADIQGRDLSYAQIRNAGIDASLTYTRTGVKIEQAVLDWNGQKVSAAGAVGLGRNQTLNLATKIESGAIENLLAAAGRSDLPVTGTVSGEIQIGGTSTRPLVNANLRGSNIVAYGERFGELTARLGIDGDLVTIERLRLDQPEAGFLEAAGAYHLKNRNFTGQATASGIALRTFTLADGTPVRGVINLKAEGSGTEQDPQLRASLNASGLQVRDQQIGDLTASVTAANQQAKFEAGVPKYNLTASGQGGIREPYPLTFEVKATKLDLASLPIQWKEPITGTVTGVVAGSGTVRDWKNGEAKFNLEQLDLRYRNEEIRSEGPIVASYRNNLLTIDQATVRAANSTLRVTGSLPLEKTGSGSIDIDAKLDLARVAPLLPLEKPITAHGEATVQANLRGTLQNIDPTGEVTLRNASFDAPGMKLPVSDVQMTAGIQNGVVDLRSLTAVFGPANVSASGVLPLGVLGDAVPAMLPKGAGPAKFRAEVKDLAIAALPGVPERVAGDVSVLVEGSAPRAELNAVDATITFPQLSLRMDRLAFEQPAPSIIRIANGVARVERFELTGPQTKLQLAGTASLMDPQTVNLKATGTAEAGLLSVFTTALKASGPVRLELAASGPLTDPQLSGFVEYTNGQLRLPDPQIEADNLHLRIDLSANRAVISEMKGSLNGGSVTGSGAVAWSKGEITDATVDLRARNVYMDYPEDLRTISNTDLTLRTANGRMTLGGQVTVLEGSFNDDVNIDEGVMAFLERQPELGLTEDRNPALEKLAFDIKVDSSAPIVIDNNLAKVEVNVDLRVVGNYYQPSLVGRVNLEEGGEVYLQERRYLVERGVVTFTNERRIEPILDMLARTQVPGYDITLQVETQPNGRRTETTLTSDPPLPEPDILALLLTGRTLEEIRGQEVDVARDQVLSYLTGRVGGALGRQLQQATGLSTVRVEPELIANERDPTARLTVGQNITRNLSLIYSMNLRDSQDQVWVAEYDITRRFQTRGIRQEDNTFRMEFRHDLQFGGFREPGRLSERQQRRFGSLTFSGTPYFTPEVLAKRLKVKEGKRYDFFKLRKGLDKLEEKYRDEGLLESRMRLERQVEGSTVNLNLNVTAGPKVEFVFEGMEVAGKLRERVEEIWHSGVFDTQRAEDSVMEIRKALVKDNFLQPQIEYKITPGDPKRVLFDIQRGLEYRDVKLVFEGASQVEPKDLEKILDKQDLELAVYTAPDSVIDALGRYYREQGFMSVSIQQPRFELDSATRQGRVVIPVTEGPRSIVASIVLNGNSSLDESRVREELPLQVGKEFTPALREQSLAFLQERYAGLAFNDAIIEHRVKRSAEDGRLDVIFDIAENNQSVISEIKVLGNDKVSERLIRSQVTVKPGDLLVLDQVSQSRRNLYNTGAFSLVDVEREYIEGPPQFPNQRPVMLQVTVREIQPYALRYGGYMDTERGPGGIVDISNRNSLGSARVVGLRTRYDADYREGRLYFSQPTLLRFPVKTISAAFLTRELHEGFFVDRKGLSAQQEARFGRNYVFNYGYRVESTKLVDRTIDPILGEPLPPVINRIAPLTATLTRETRDDILDATRGSFASGAFEYAPSLLGSQIRYVKFFSQFFKYFPLSEPADIPWLKSVRRSRFVYATGVRYGAAGGLGGDVVIPSERFFAGGGTTIRGFRQDEAGPLAANGTPDGGNTVFVLNNEIRAPLAFIFDGVGFVDIGNVFPRVSDFSFGDLRRTAGVGIRARTPWFLIRMDYGVKLDRRPGETSGRLFFSIGQAF